MQWQTLFLITTAFYVASTLFYVVCGSGKLQRWALGDATARQQVPVRQTDGLTPRAADPGSRPQSGVVRHFSSPSSVYPTKPGVGDAPYCSDSLRRAAEAARSTAAAAAPNHFSGDDSDPLDDRKPSSKSTSSSKTPRDDVTSAPARRTDHDRPDHATRMRSRDQSMSAKQQRHSKQPPQTRPSSTPTPTTTTPPVLPTSPDEGLRIYESLSESPV